MKLSDVNNCYEIYNESLKIPYINPNIFHRVMGNIIPEVIPKEMSLDLTQNLMKEVFDSNPNPIIRYYGNRPIIEEPMTEWEFYDTVGKMGFSVESCIKPSNEFPHYPTKVSTLFIFANYGTDFVKQCIDAELNS